MVVQLKKHLGLLIAVALLAGLALPAATVALPRTTMPRTQALDSAPTQAQSDDAFLEDLSKRTFSYFVEQADRDTGLVLDRARTDGSPQDETHRNVASI